MKPRRISDDQARLPFGGRTIARARALPFALERRAIGTLAILLILMGGVYTYLVIRSIGSVVERERLTEESNRLLADVSRLESEYLTRADTLTEARARSLGFVRAPETFVERGTFSLVRTGEVPVAHAQ